MSELKEKYDQYSNYIPSTTPAFPNVMLLETTNYCNHSCVFCSHSNMTRPKGFMSESLAYRLLEEAYEAGVKEVGFYIFGEPLVDRNLEKYISYAKELGFSYTFFTTNGALLNEERMIRLIDSGIDSIKFSINGSNREHYRFAHGADCFQQVKDNVIRLSNYRKVINKNFKIYISSVLTKYTQNDGIEIRNIFSSYVDDIIIHHCHSFGGHINDKLENNLEIQDVNNPYYNRDFCFQPFNRLHISYEGYLTLCCADYQNYLVVEDLNNITLKEAWHSDKFQQIRQRHMDGKLEGTLCYNCLNSTVSSIKPISEEFAYSYCQSSDEGLDMIQSRIDRLLESDPSLAI